MQAIQDEGCDERDGVMAFTSNVVIPSDPLPIKPAFGLMGTEARNLLL